MFDWIVDAITCAFGCTPWWDEVGQVVRCRRCGGPIPGVVIQSTNTYSDGTDANERRALSGGSSGAGSAAAASISE